jgi:hypothetical protein
MQMPRAIRSDCRPTASPQGLRAIIRHYRKNYAARAEWELGFFRAQSSLKDAVRLAGLAQGPGGKRFSHRCRIPGRVLAEAEQLLQIELRMLRKAATFAQLHRIVRSMIGDVRGIGALMVYDTSLRIAVHLGLEPSQVFLHAGTRVGARALGLDASAESLSVAELPRALRRISAGEVEDILCIYKHSLASARSTRSS